MVLDLRTRRIGYGLGLGLPALALGFAALAQRPAGPVCAEVAEAIAAPGVDLFDGPILPRPACIRVPLTIPRQSLLHSRGSGTGPLPRAATHRVT